MKDLTVVAGGDSIGRIVILELTKRDSSAFEDIQVVLIEWRHYGKRFF